MKTFATIMTIEAATASDHFQLELLDWRSNVELKEVFKSKSLHLDFESRVPEGKYPNLIENAFKNALVSG